MSKSKKSKKPSAPKITRNGNNFEFSWSNGEKYKSLKLKYKLRTGKKFPKKATSKTPKKSPYTIKCDSSKKLYAVWFSISGTASKKKASKTATKTLNLKAPRKPTVGLSPHESYRDRAIFAWSVDARKNDAYWFDHVEYVTRLKDNVTGKYLNSGKWEFHTSKSASGTFTIQEDSTQLEKPGVSLTREAKAKSVGPAGSSDWSKLATVTYCAPGMPVVSSAVLTENISGGYDCTVNWTTRTDNKYPVDYMSAEYCICTISAESYVVYELTDDDEVHGDGYYPTTDEKIQNGKVYYYYDEGDEDEDEDKEGTYIKVSNPKDEEIDSYYVFEKAKTYYTYNASTGLYSIVADPVNEKLSNYYERRIDDSVLDVPQNPSWQKAKNFGGFGKSNKTESDSAYFQIDTLLKPDEVMFVRVVAHRTNYENNDTPSVPFKCTFGKSTPVASLLPPTGVSVTIGTNNRITVNATPTSTVNGSFMVVKYYTNDDPTNIITIGVMTNKSGTFEVPSTDAFGIGVYSAIGTYEEHNDNNGYTYFTVDSALESSITWVKGGVPIPPPKPKLAHVDPGVIEVTWDWTWAEADKAELSWSNYKDAWESTSSPSTYQLDAVNDGRWKITGLTIGEEWFVRVRLLKTGDDDAVTYSRWSDVSSLYLSAAPATPNLELNPNWIVEGGTFTASWAYITNDNTPQAHANLVLDDGETSIVQVGAEQSVSIDTSSDEFTNIFKWKAGDTYNLMVQVQSESGLTSEYSNALPLTVVNPVSCEINLGKSTLVNRPESVEVVNVEDDTVTVETVTKYYLEELTDDKPFTIKIDGASDSDTTTLIIERYGSFPAPRPDDNIFVGFDGEVIFSESHTGSDAFVVTDPDGFNDRGDYIITAYVEDEYGQVAETTPVIFTVDWNHKAKMPSANIEIGYRDTNDDGYVDDGIAIITPIAPEGTETGDVVDIYRLSADKPELLVENGVWGTPYVDPFPTIGIMGGYRVVFKTRYGDYLTSEEDGNMYSWLDYTADDGYIFDTIYNIIDFDNDRVELMLNVDFDSTWDKDFKTTTYMDGSVEGDWNSAVSRSGTITANVISNDTDTIRALRRLATHASECRIRSKEGSNYTANINVTENTAHEPYYDSNGEFVKIISYSLNISAVDPDDPEGLTLAEWLEEQEVEGDELD